jgi:hypothetical protein
MHTFQAKRPCEARAWVLQAVVTNRSLSHLFLQLPSLAPLARPNMVELEGTANRADGMAPPNLLLLKLPSHNSTKASFPSNSSM